MCVCVYVCMYVCMNVVLRTRAAVWSNTAPVCARVALPSGHVMLTNTLSCRLFTVFALGSEHVAGAHYMISIF